MRLSVKICWLPGVVLTMPILSFLVLTVEKKCSVMEQVHFLVDVVLDRSYKQTLDLTISRQKKSSN